jgi:hypothetical protein
MKILRSNQYNQGISKSKLLSSTSGVGSIVTSKIGTYILVSDIDKWSFIQWVNSKIKIIRSQKSDDNEVYNLSKAEVLNRGLEIIDDHRFIKFIKSEKGLDNLVCLVGIPHMSLNESFNTPKWENNPIQVALKKSGEPHQGRSKDYMINATHFPKWFKNSQGHLKRIGDWESLWDKECRKYPNKIKKSNFSPPRDATTYLRDISSRNEDGNPIKIREYRQLEQTNIVLICPNGHLSDIPWPNYLKWKTEKYLRERPDEDKGEDIMSFDLVGPCCSNPKLKWTESKNKSEGYGSIYLECTSCSLGSGQDNVRPKINLEGLNSLQPNCSGHKPWEINIDSNANIRSENCYVENDISKGREKLKVSLVTANNVYYSNGFSSLFIPIHIAENISPELVEAIDLIERKYLRYFNLNGMTREKYWDSKFDIDDFLIENDITPDVDIDFQYKLKTLFFSAGSPDLEEDYHEAYRWQEYNCFSRYSSLPDIELNEGLSFNEITLPNALTQFFTKIQQVEELKMTNVQFDFTRVKPKERIVVKGVVQPSKTGQNIFSNDHNEVHTIPANESLGEGIFFEFSNLAIDDWISENQIVLSARFGQYITDVPNPNSQGLASKMLLFNNGFKQFLIHSFSHLIMRELEFSCGYPTASLKERLYISNSSEKLMSGVLIYAAEGSEGSMGGLVSQGEPDMIIKIIKEGLRRSMECSSDPLCWESEGQGIFDLNLSSCFSCSLVAETACEEMNLGLDRRVLVDENFGFFKTLIFT